MTAVELKAVGPEHAATLLDLARAFHTEDGYPLASAWRPDRLLSGRLCSDESEQHKSWNRPRV